MPGPPEPADDVRTTAEWRRALIGEWTVEFRVDSMRVFDGSTARWRTGVNRTTTGMLRFTGIRSSDTTYLTSSFDIDFTSVLGRPMSCFDPRPTLTQVNRDQELIRLWFTPGAADCGFSGFGTLKGDSLIGAWDETSFAGSMAMGRVRMHRVRR
jgi:hypothetical protein